MIHLQLPDKDKACSGEPGPGAFCRGCAVMVAWLVALPVHAEPLAAPVISAPPASTTAEEAPPAVAPPAESEAVVQPASNPEAGVVELVLPPGLVVNPDPAAAERVVLTWKDGDRPLRIRIPGSPDVVVQPGQEATVAVVTSAPPQTAVAPPVVQQPSSSPSMPIPPWLGTMLLAPLGVACTLLTGAALAVASLLWTMPANEPLGEGALTVRLQDRQQRGLALVSLVAAGILGLVTLGLVTLPFALERAGWMEPA